MKFNIGDPVVHWTYGLGNIIGKEEREISGKKQVYYEVRVNDLTVWVPADEQVTSRLRQPTSAAEFDQLFSILASPGEPLPENRLERKVEIVEKLKDGRADTLCRVIRDLSCYQQIRALNETDHGLMNRVHNTLIGEWVYALSISVLDAEKELRQILSTCKPVELASK
jgi:CarD family transcriptional regulator